MASFPFHITWILDVPPDSAIGETKYPSRRRTVFQLKEWELAEVLYTFLIAFTRVTARFESNNQGI
jgi:hypothetical protein